MRVFRIVLLTALIAALLPGLAHSQDVYFPQFIEFNTIGGGARAAGMGGAFLGISDDEMAYSWNPAGMMFIKKPAIGLQFVSAADKFKIPFVLYSDSLTIHEAASSDADRKHFGLNFSGCAVPFTFMQWNWAVGGGYRNVYDMKYKIETVGFFQSTSSFIQSDGLDAISVAAAGRIVEGVALGVTINDFVRGPETNFWVGKAILIPNSGNAPPDTVDAWYNNNVHFSGVSVDIGLMGEYSIARGSFVLHTPYVLSQSNLLTYSAMTPPVPLGVIYRLTSTTHVPMGFSLGLSVRPLDKLVLAADFDNRPMSKTRFDENWEPLTLPDTNNVNPHWKDLNQFRVGAEYTINAGFADVAIRAGLRNIPSVIGETVEDINGNITYGKQFNPTIFAFGTGLRFKRAWVDLAYQFGRKSYSSSIDFGTPVVFENKMDYSRLFVSTGMYF
jgi:hypothetical protein